MRWTRGSVLREVIGRELMRGAQPRRMHETHRQARGGRLGRMLGVRAVVRVRSQGSQPAQAAKLVDVSALVPAEMHCRQTVHSDDIQRSQKACPAASGRRGQALPSAPERLQPPQCTTKPFLRGSCSCHRRGGRRRACR